MKRVILIVAVTAIAWAGFAFLAKQTGSEAHAHEEHGMKKWILIIFR